MEDVENYDEDEFFTRKSRSQKKRESTALQELGVELTIMGEGDLVKLDLPDKLLQAVFDWKSFPTHEAKRRQMQYIGKLMREINDIEALQTAIASSKGDQKITIAIMHAAEDLRSKLTAHDEGEREKALSELLSMYPLAEKAQLQHLINGSLSNNKKNASRMSRELFRYLREMLLQHK